MTNLITFCKNLSLGFVPVNYRPQQKQKYQPLEGGYKDFNFKESLEVVRLRGEGDGLFINIKDKFIVIDTDDKQSDDVMKKVFHDINIQPFVTKSFSNIKAGNNYKNHYWFKIDKSFDKIIKFNNLELDVITDIIAEHKSTKIDWEAIPSFPKILEGLFYDKREKNIETTKKDYDNSNLLEEEVSALLEVLDKKRKDNYQDWILVGLALKNTNEDLLGVFNDWSKSSKKYKGFTDVKKFWQLFTQKPDGLTIGTIRFWAKLDHPTKYSAWYEKYHPSSADFIEEQAQEALEDEEKQYQKLAEEFNKIAFKLEHPPLYCYQKPGGELRMVKKTNFRDLFEEMAITTKKVLKSGKIKTVRKSFINKWFTDKNKTVYERLDFLPKQEVPKGVYNTFDGFEAENLPPKITGNLFDSRIMKHIKNLACNDDKIFKYLINWMAFRVQRPWDTTRNSSLVIKGAEGTGKNLFFDWFGTKIIGRKYYSVTGDIDNVFGKFNTIVKDKILVVVNELDRTSFKYKERIKDFIVSEKLDIQEKGKDQYFIENNTGFVFITNNFNVMDISEKDRRFVLLDIGDKNAQKVDYFTPLVEEMKSGLYDYEFYNYLNTLDISGFEPQKDRPITQYYKDIQYLNRPPMIDFFIDFHTKYYSEKIKEKPGKLLFDEYRQFLVDEGMGNFMSNRKFGLLVQKFDFVCRTRPSKGTLYTIDIKKLKDYLLANKYIEDDFIDN